MYNNHHDSRKRHFDNDHDNYHHDSIMISSYVYNGLYYILTSGIIKGIMKMIMGMNV